PGVLSIIFRSPSARLRGRSVRLSGAYGFPGIPSRPVCPLSSAASPTGGGPFDRPRPRSVAPLIFCLCSFLRLQSERDQPADGVCARQHFVGWSSNASIDGSVV